MTLRADLLRTVLVQGGGSLSVLAAVLVLGAWLGPAVQGTFSRTKAEVEFLSALAGFGLPQAMFYFAQRGRLTLPRARGLSMRVAAAGLALGLGYALWAAGRTAGAAGLLAFALAVAAGAGYGPLRALLLTRTDSLWFNVATALPQVGLLFVALAWGALRGGEAALAIGLALAYAVPAVLAARQLRPFGEADPSGPVRAGELLHFGAAAWLAGALASGAIVLAQRLVEHHLGAASLGVFSLALTVSLVPLMPVSFATPILFRHWMATPGSGLPLATLGGIAGAIALVAGLAATMAAAWPGFGFGTAYEALGAVLPAMLLATSGEAVSRLLATKANARGRPWHVVAAEVVRAAVLLGGGLTALAGAPLGAFAWLWAAAAWLTAATLAPMARAVPEAGSVNGVRS